MVVVVCVLSVSFRKILFVFSPQSLNIKDWNVQCKLNAMLLYLEKEMVNFGLETLLSSYGVICSPWVMMVVASSPESSEEQIPVTGCLSTWQFNLYNKSDGDQSEIQRTRLPKTMQPNWVAFLSISRNWRRGLIWHPPVLDCVVVYIAFCSLHTQPATWLHCT